MKRSCRYCGKLHEYDYICPYKPKMRYKKTEYDYDSYRNTQEWKKIREEIRERDYHICQLCVRGLHDYGTRKYNTKNVSVHHIIPLKDDYERRSDRLNLITLCAVHHKMADTGGIDSGLLLEIAREQESPRGLR